MKIAVVGTGYDGLVTGACLGEVGNEVLCTDVDDSAAIDETRRSLVRPRRFDSSGSSNGYVGQSGCFVESD